MADLPAKNLNEQAATDADATIHGPVFLPRTHTEVWRFLFFWNLELASEPFDLRHTLFVIKQR